MEADVFDFICVGKFSLSGSDKEERGWLTRSGCYELITEAQSGNPVRIATCMVCKRRFTTAAWCAERWPSVYCFNSVLRLKFPKQFLRDGYYKYLFVHRDCVPGISALKLRGITHVMHAETGHELTRVLREAQHLKQIVKKIHNV